MTEKNGTPQFNFRKRGYRDEIRLSRLQIEIGRIGTRIDTLDPSEDASDLLDKLQAIEIESLDIVFGVVEYLPESYLREGVKSDDIDYEDTASIIDNLRFGAANDVSLKIADARREHSKNS